MLAAVLARVLLELVVPVLVLVLVEVLLQRQLLRQQQLLLLWVEMLLRGLPARPRAVLRPALARSL